MKSMYPDEMPLMKMGPELTIYSSRLTNQTYVSKSRGIITQSFSIAKGVLQSNDKGKK
jgi:hypothetical protein